MLEDLIQEYLHYAEHDRGDSPRTLYSNRYQFKLFLDYMGNRQVDDITIQDLSMYFQSEEERGLAVSSVNTARRVIRQFFYYCQYYKQIALKFDYNMIKAKRADPPDIRWADSSDVARVLRVLQDPQDKLMVLVLNQTLVRVSELVKICVEDIDGCEIRVLGKGRRRRLVNTTPELADSIQKHLIDNNIKAGPIFRTHLHSSTPGRGYTVSGLRNRFILKLQPYGLHAGFHWYRRGGAVELMRNGATLVFIKEYLGHSDIRTTQKYLMITDREKQGQFNEYYKSPVDIRSVLTLN